MISRKTIEVVLSTMILHKLHWFDVFHRLNEEISPYWQRQIDAIAELEAALKEMDTQTLLKI